MVILLVSIVQGRNPLVFLAEPVWCCPVREQTWLPVRNHSEWIKMNRGKTLIMSCLVLINHREDATSDKVLPVYTDLRPIHSMCAAVLNSPSCPSYRARGADGRLTQQRHDSVDLLPGCFPGLSCPLCRIMLSLIKGQNLKADQDYTMAITLYHDLELP